MKPDARWNVVDLFGTSTHLLPHGLEHGADGDRTTAKPGMSIPRPMAVGEGTQRASFGFPSRTVSTRRGPARSPAPAAPRRQGGRIPSRAARRSRHFTLMGEERPPSPPTPYFAAPAIGSRRQRADGTPTSWRMVRLRWSSRRSFRPVVLHEVSPFAATVRSSRSDHVDGNVSGSEHRKTACMTLAMCADRRPSSSPRSTGMPPSIRMIREKTETNVSQTGTRATSSAAPRAPGCGRWTPKAPSGWGSRPLVHVLGAQPLERTSDHVPSAPGLQTPGHHQPRAGPHDPCAAARR